MGNVLKLKKIIFNEISDMKHFIFKIYIVFSCFYGSYIFWYPFENRGSFYTEAPKWIYLIKDVVFMTFVLINFYLIFKKGNIKKIYINNKNILNNYVCFFFLYVFLCAIHFFHKDYIEIFQHNYRNILMYSLIIPIVIFNEISLNTIMKFLIRVLNLAIIISFFGYFIGVGIGAWGRLFGTMLNPNNLGLITVFLFINVYLKYLNKGKLFDLILLVIFIGIILLTNSWQNILLLVISFFLLLFFNGFIKEVYLLRILILLLIGLILFNINDSNIKRKIMSKKIEVFDKTILLAEKFIKDKNENENNNENKITFNKEYEYDLLSSIHAFKVKEEQWIQLPYNGFNYNYILLKPGYYQFYNSKYKKFNMDWGWGSDQLFLLKVYKKSEIIIKCMRKVENLYIIGDLNDWKIEKMEKNNNNEGFYYKKILNPGYYYYYYYSKKRFLYGMDVKKRIKKIVEYSMNKVKNYQEDDQNTTVSVRIKNYLNYYYFIKNKFYNFFLGDFFIEKYKKYDSQHLNILRNEGFFAWLLFFILFIKAILEGLKKYILKVFKDEEEHLFNLVVTVFLFEVFFIAFLTTAYLNRFPLNFIFYFMISYLLLYKPKNNEMRNKNENIINKSTVSS